ncbi:MAG: hypothetical protein B7Z55_12465 [Planctomycetales bacterium 12-60-4]|nr:MAG: hypothetical protein B7Z55_12465 [Planctomycetales bacterium 12-60-4]
MPASASNRSAETVVAASTKNLEQSQWALIWRQFRKRRIAVACAAVIVALITISIFAPFLANDRPLYYRGSNRFEYREAVRTIREVLARLADSSGDASTKNRVELRKALALQGTLMQAALATEPAAKLRALVDDALSAAAQPDGAAKLREIRRQIQSQFGGRDVPLASRTYSPILASLGGVEIGFMAWNLLLLTAPVWLWVIRRCVSAERATLRHRLIAAMWIGGPLICGIVWWCTVPARIDRTDYKQAVMASDETAATALVVYESVIWPPVPYGIDEDDLSQKEAKPAWFAGEPKVSAKASPWNGPHWLGTDNLGRDILCRMIWGKGSARFRNFKYRALD